ncbi:Acyl-CoA thioesterase [Pseudomonas sp. OF001]|uniref:acyl-CoA thioesterase n=1 Tax=unclassified Pseudomonas TaxID=196821 RepID=UPI001919FDF1|nr:MULTISPECIES: thioesterase family protein [unclassified Pseudomonas]WPP47522.1 thioesterase family protein [Pseudomonas sp. AN-1]CAD5376533.1 Acyl-CoA thioesterase [Pseudomonas sp. OF001]
MSWERPAPFVLDIKVGTEHIDEFAHVNNAVYVGWLEQCAWAHSRSLGLTLDDYRRLDRGMLVVRHEIDYLAAAREGERLELGTWIVECDGRLSIARQFQLRRPADGVTLLRARTRFVCAELSSGRPRRMPAEFVERYGRALVVPAAE